MRQTLAPVAALLIGVAILFAGQGLQGTLLPVRAGLESFSTVSIGIMGAAYFLGFTIGCLRGGDLVRRVEIYTEPGKTVPCEVHYFKDTEAPGESEVLWSAEAQAGFCEQKAAEFVAKLQGWGWECGASEDAAPEPVVEPGEADVPDDTDVLSPGDPSGG